MKILIDTNVVLDVILKREPYFQEAVDVLSLAKKDNMKEYVSASAVTDIYYIAYRALKSKEAVRRLLKDLFVVVSIAGVTKQEITKALEMDWKDFEDSVQYSVALLQDMDCVVTRNPKDYESAEIQIWTPTEALKSLE